ncbi:MAG TPA: hypothetical protein VK009_29950 [Chloroflexota bacterium]|nr:hypothetical protein [Chloroflexota bacterium]
MTTDLNDLYKRALTAYADSGGTEVLSDKFSGIGWRGKASYVVLRNKRKELLRVYRFAPDGTMRRIARPPADFI